MMMNVRTKRYLARMLAVVMVIALLAVPGLAETFGGQSVQATTISESPDLREFMNNPAPLYDLPDLVSSFRGRVQVTVEMATPTTVDLGLIDLNLSPESEMGQALQTLAAQHRQYMRSEQNETQAQIATLYPDAQFRYSYTNLINGFQAQIPYELIADVEAMDGVLAVHVHTDTPDNYTLNQNEPEDSDFGWIHEEFELEFLPLDGEDATDTLAELMPVSLIQPLSCHGAWGVHNVREAWNLGFTGAGRVAGILDTMIRDTHQAYSYMDPIIAANQPDGFISRETIMQRVQDNVDTLNFLDLDGWESWFHWEHPNRTLGATTGGMANPIGFRDPVMRDRLLEGAFWRSDKVPFNLCYFHGRYQLPPAFHNHGTGVSSITLGHPGPNMINGFLGIAHDAQLFGLNVYSTGAGQDPNVQETDDGAFAAIEDSITLGVHSFNMSYGTRHGTTTKHHVLSRVGYQSAFIRAAELGMSITASAGNQHRNVDMDSLVGARPTWLPNAGTVGFPNELFSVISVAAAQSPRNVIQAFNLTNMLFTDAAGQTVAGLESQEERAFVAAPLEIRDNNVGQRTVDGVVEHFSHPLGLTFRDAENTPDVLRVVNVGTGTQGEISAAGSLTGRVALITTSDDLIGAQQRAQAAGAVAAIIANTEDRIVVMSNFSDPHRIEHMIDERFADPVGFPIIGQIRSSHATVLRNALAAGEVNVSFISRAVTIPGNANVTRADIGPMGFTCWGVTDSLRLSPDIMGPGGNVLMANAGTSNFGYSTGSGTSMSAPAVNGVLLLVQQSVLQRIEDGVFENVTGLFANLQPGTLEFNLLVNMLAMNTSRVYQVYPMTPTTPTAVSVTNVPNPNSYRFFSPRRQGAGMANAGHAVQSNVVLHNGNEVTYNPYTGEAPRGSLSLGSGLEQEFEFSFVMENFNNVPRTFDVSTVLQTDATIVLANGVRALPSGQQTDGSEIDSIPEAIMTVANVSGDARIVDSATNINRYNDNSGVTRITVPARSSTIVTIAVDARNADFEQFEEFFPNGMFLEGFVWFEAAGDTPIFESVNIPFMGFYGCWNTAPIFDQADAYTDISGLTVTDTTHPMFHTTAMHGTVARDRSADGAMLEICDMGEIVLGANQFTDQSWGGYAMVGRGTTAALTRPGAPGGASTGQTATMGGNLVLNARTYLNTIRAAGHLDRDFIAFSPGEESMVEQIYANLMLLRNAKTIGVVIRDADGEIVNILGPEFDFFRTRTQYDHAQWHWAALHGGRHFRNMGWDGTDFDGNIVEDGQYFYEVRAMLEYEFLAMTNENPGEATDMEALTEALLTSPTVQYTSFPVLIDTRSPLMTTSPVASNTLRVDVADSSGIQAIGLFHDGELVGDVVLVSDTSVTHTFNLGVIPNVNPNLLVVQAVDFALNLTSLGVDETNAANLTTLEVNPGVLTPAFAGNVFGYSVYVGAANSITVAADAPEGYIIRGTGVHTFTGNSRIVEVIVTSPCGEREGVYTITVTRNPDLAPSCRADLRDVLGLAKDLNPDRLSAANRRLFQAAFNNALRVYENIYATQAEINNVTNTLGNLVNRAQ